MMTAAYFRMLARYNGWANRRLLMACAELSEEERVQDRSAFFGSIHATFNHILVADRIWLRRLTGSGKVHTDLSDCPYPDYASFVEARKDEDERILSVMGGYSDLDIAGSLSYENMAGKPFTRGLAPVLGHVFNHQTHHRGHIHAMVSQAGHTPPPLDIIYFLDEDEQSADG